MTWETCTVEFGKIMLKSLINDSLLFPYIFFVSVTFFYYALPLQSLDLHIIVPQVNIEQSTVF